MSSDEHISVTTIVEVEPAAAFSIFTGEIGSWWKPRIPHLFHEERTGILKFEPGPGGRLLEVYPESSHDPVEVGRILAWVPGERLVFEWRQAGFGPAEVTHVEIRFEAVPSGTRIILEHRGWESIRPHYPGRRGCTGQSFVSMIGVRWADQLTFLRIRIKNSLNLRSIQEDSHEG